MSVAPGWADVGGSHVPRNPESHAKGQGCSSVCNGEAVTCVEQGGDMTRSVSE